MKRYKYFKIKWFSGALKILLRDVRIHYCTTHDSKTGITNKEKKISPIFVDFMIMIVLDI